MPGKKRITSEPLAPADMEEEDFVRGGGSELPPIVHKQIKDEAFAEAEADLKRQVKRRKTAKAGGVPAQAVEAGDEEDLFFDSLTARDQLPKYVELLKFRSLTPGSKIWGCITEIKDKELIVALPHGLKGHVRYDQTSDFVFERFMKSKKEKHVNMVSKDDKKGKEKKERKGMPVLDHLFRLGQLVRCYITNLTGADTEGDKKESSKVRKRIELSIHVGKINASIGKEAIKEGVCLPACVYSVEDHGYILSFGIDGVEGFLPKAKADISFEEGSIVEVVVDKPPQRPGAPAFVTADTSVVKKTVTYDWDGLNIATLLPGSLVNVRVRNVLSDGLLVSFLTFFSGTIDPFHIGIHPSRSIDEKRKGKSFVADALKRFSPNQRMKARILYVDATSKQVCLTLLPQLLAAEIPIQSFPPIGKVIETGEVIDVQPGLGLIISLEGKGIPDVTESDNAFKPTLGFAHVSNLSEEHLENIENRFRPGQIVKCRVIGSRPMDGIAALSLKSSVVDASALTLSDISPGLKIDANVAKVEPNFLLLQLTPHIKAIVPSQHMSEASNKKTYKKFKVGQHVSGRVLAIDQKRNKVLVTMKQTLVNSKLPIITCLNDAIPGSRSHGMVSGVHDYGIFVTFFGGMSGLVRKDDAGLPPNQSLDDAFVVGQIVKCRVVDVDLKKGRLQLSLVAKKNRPGEAEDRDKSSKPAEGAFVKGVVRSVRSNDENEPSSFTLDLFPLEFDVTDKNIANTLVEESSNVSQEELQKGPIASGRLDVSHLADHPSAALALAEALRVGTSIGPLLVLQNLKNINSFRLTRKLSLIHAMIAKRLPVQISELQENSVIPGYVASVASDAVYIRFLGDLTGRAGLAQLSDTFVADPSAYFSIGETVLAHIVQIDSEKQRFLLSLKRSLTAGDSDGSYLQSLFQDIDTAYKFSILPEVDEPKNSQSTETPVDWASEFRIGDVIQASVHGHKDYGLLIDIPQQPDVVGLAAPHHLPQPMSSYRGGESVSVVVLDISKKDGIVDVSLLPKLLERASARKGENNTKALASAKKRGKHKKSERTASLQDDSEQHVLSIDDKTNGTVLLSKSEEGYCVVSLPDRQHPWLGFLATAGFNLSPEVSSSLQPQPGQVLSCVVSMLPSVSSDFRLILRMSSSHLVNEKIESKGERKESQNKLDVGANGKGKPRRHPGGSHVVGKVASIHPLHIDVVLNDGSRGRIHITESKYWESDAPLSNYMVGNEVNAIVLGRASSTGGRRHGLMELSTRADSDEKDKRKYPPLSWTQIKKGDGLRGFVQDIKNGWIWISFSPYVRGRAFLPTSSTNIEECIHVSKTFHPGDVVYTRVVDIDSEKRSLDVELLKSDDDGKAIELIKSHGMHARGGLIKQTKTGIMSVNTGDIVLGIIASVSGKTGITISLGPKGVGHVSLLEIHDDAVENAIENVHTGQYVCGKIMDCRDDNKDTKSSKKSIAHWNMTLKPSCGGACPAHDKAKKAPLSSKALSFLPSNATVSDLQLGQKVIGYVKAVSSVGVFVWITPNINGRVKLRQLSDTFIENPQAAFPEGRYVEGTIVDLDGGKVEMSFRHQKAMQNLDTMAEGQIVRGRVQRIEKYGVFVALEGSNITGLAHLSALADNFVQDPGKLFKLNQFVRARVLSVDVKKGRLALGLKPSYFVDVSTDEEMEEGDIGMKPEFENQSSSENDFDEELMEILDVEREDNNSKDGVDHLRNKTTDDSHSEDFDMDEEILAEVNASDSETD